MYMSIYLDSWTDIINKINKVLTVVVAAAALLQRSPLQIQPSPLPSPGKSAVTHPDWFVRGAHDRWTKTRCVSSVNIISI